jgi:hypothetical protein
LRHNLVRLPRKKYFSEKMAGFVRGFRLGYVTGGQPAKPPIKKENLN